jgi:hypothetical protein
MDDTNMDLVETLRDPHVSRHLCDTAFNYVNNKHGKFTLETCLLSILDKNIPEDFVIPVGITTIRLIDKHSATFDEMKSGLSSNMKQSIMDKMSEKLSESLQ